MDLQKHVFKVVKSKIPKTVLLVDEIETIFGKGTDSAYRRIRGEKELTISEIKKIAEKYELSIDELLFQKSRRVATFRYTPVAFSGEEDYAAYIAQMAEWLSCVAEYGNDGEFLFTAKEIPFYHFVNYPELAFFILFAWSDTINPQKIAYADFCAALDKSRITEIYDKMYHSFLHIPSREIWTEQTIDATLRLLEYYFSIGTFSKDDAMMLLDRLTSLINSVNQHAEYGYKNDRKVPFVLYSCAVDLDNNFMLTRRGEHLDCIVKLYSINRIKTDNELLCAETLKWINSLISKSNLISGGAAFRERLNFFNVAKKKIQTLIDKIEAA